MPDPKDDDDKDPPEPDPDAGTKTALANERRQHRDTKKQLSDLQSKLRDLENKDKPELERLGARVKELEQDLADANGRVTRYEVALDKGLSKTQARRLVGDTEEELAADAEDLLASFTDKDKGSGGGTPSKPTEDLKGGGDPTNEPVEMDPRKLAADVPRY